LNRKLLIPSVLDAVIKKINSQELTNSKDVRKLRLVLRDPVSRDEFLSESGSIESALLKLGPAASKKREGLAADIQALAESIKGYSWTTLANAKGDPELLRTLEETEKLLKELRRTLGKT
jgi:ParB family chromosome partitioning protein